MFASRTYVLLATFINVIGDADWLIESVSSMTSLSQYRVEAMCACAGTSALMKGLLVQGPAVATVHIYYQFRIALLFAKCWPLEKGNVVQSMEE